MDEGGRRDDHEALLAAIARGDVDALERLYRERRAPAAASDEPQLWVGALMALPADERAIVALRIIGGLTHREIANQLGVPAGTVRWKYRLALRRLEEADLD